MTAWAYAMTAGGTIVAPEVVQVIADTPAECAEGACAAGHELSGAPWRLNPGDSWDAVADRWAADIHVVPA